ncbi:MAG: sigma-70 family RNA polymerase sigma factor [Colwellia sp.]|nr:sigma-70 family RNA polymerase sigma factor [Colwellia sp.]
MSISSGTKKIGFQQVLPKSVIKLAQQGDIESFEIIYKTYFDACYRSAFRICNNQMTAQDLVQEVFIKAMKSLSDYKFNGSFAGWLKQITVRVAIDHINRDNKVNLVNDEDMTLIPSNDLFDFNWLESCRDLDFLLSQLSITSRAVLLLHEVEGYNHKEIAQLYQKSESFSKVTLSRAYIQLKKLVLSQEKKSAFK